MEHSRWQHIGPEEAYALGCGPQVSGIHQYWCSNENFNQVGSILYCSSASLSTIGVFQNVDERGSLVCLEEVDHSDEIVEKSEAWIHSTELSSSPAPSRSTGPLIVIRFSRNFKLHCEMSCGNFLSKLFMAEVGNCFGYCRCNAVRIYLAIFRLVTSLSTYV